MIISIIIPTFNDVKLGFLKSNLAILSKVPNCEVICVDGGSKDSTIELIKSFPVTLVEIENHSRAHRLNVGISYSKGEYLFLHHPRSSIDVSCFEQIRKQGPLWGGLTHQFDNKKYSPVLSFTSWYSNKVRFKYKSIIYLDHCIFFKRTCLEQVGNIPEVDIFEDTLLSLKLKALGRPTRLDQISLTSDVRFSTNGILKQALMNQFLKLAFYFKANDVVMNKSYEKGLKLNSDYNND